MWKKSSKTHDTLLTTLEETTKLETHPGSGCRAFEIADGSLLGHDLDVKGPNVGFLDDRGCRFAERGFYVQDPSSGVSFQRNLLFDMRLRRLRRRSSSCSSRVRIALSCSRMVGPCEAYWETAVVKCAMMAVEAPRMFCTTCQSPCRKPENMTRAQIISFSESPCFQRFCGLGKISGQSLETGQASVH